jgi:hypothetical protein
VRPLAEEFQTLERGGRLSMPVHVAPSLLRAHVARLLRSDLRAHELVIVDFLRRLYVSEAARAKEPRA